MGKGWGGTAKDIAKGVAWWQQSAEQGYVLAMYNLAVYLHHGRGVPKDHALALKWYAEAARAGHPLAMTNYGLALLFGLAGGAKNEKEAIIWLTKGALQDVEVAMFHLGKLLT